MSEENNFVVVDMAGQPLAPDEQPKDFAHWVAKVNATFDVLWKAIQIQSKRIEELEKKKWWKIW